MITDLHHAGSSVVHRCPASAKLLALALSGVGLVLVDDPLILGVALAAAVGLAALARLPLWPPSRGLRGVCALLVTVALVNGFTVSWASAAAVGLRLGALILLAVVVTATTRASVLLDTLTHLLQPLRRLGVNPDAVALALALTLRFVPMLADTAREVREAQWARGLDRHPLAVFMPLLVRALTLADAVAEAIDARTPDTPTREDRREHP